MFYEWLDILIGKKHKIYIIINKKMQLVKASQSWKQTLYRIHNPRSQCTDQI